MGSKGSSTSTKTTAPPAYLNAAYMNILGQAQNIASQPYTPYTGQLTAGLTDEQQQAISGLANNQNAYQPYFNQASQSLGNVTSVTPTAYSAEEIAKYQNPYTQQVVDATTKQLQKAFGQQQNALVGNAIQSGAWGGDRAAVAQATLAGNQADTLSNTVSNLYNQSFNNAQNQFNTANQAQMNAAQTNNTNALNLGNLYAALGTGATNNSVTANNALLGAGQVEQNTEQNALNAAYQQFLNQQGWNQNQLTWLANIATGLGGAAGGTTTGTSPNSGNSISSILGAGLSLLSLSDERVKEDIEPVGELYDGQPIYRFKYLGDPTPRIGLMAQEVEEVAPEAVGSLGGLKAVDYGRATDEAAEMGRNGYAAGGYVPQVAGPGQAVAPLIVGLQMPQVQAPRGGLNAPDVSTDGGGSKGAGGFGGLGIDKDTAKAGLGSLKSLFSNKGATTEAIAKASPLDAISFGLKFADGGAVDDEAVPLIFGPAPDAEPLIWGPSPEPAPGLVPGLPQQIVPSQGDTAVAGLGRLPRGIRTNNPGNIKDSPFARSMPGYVGSDGVNAIFETPQAGLGAMNALLDSYGRRGLNTVSGILNRWAPPNADNNDTGGYVNYVAKRIGVDPNAPLTPEARAQLPAAMAYFENGREFPVDGNPLAVADASTGRITPRSAPSSGGDEAEIPANAMAAQGTAPQGLGGFNPLGLSDDMRSALLAAGLGMLAGQSRNAGENIGQGALYGLVNYQNRQDAAARAKAEAAKLQRELAKDAQTADYNERRLKLEEQRVLRSQNAEYGLNPVWGVDANGKPAILQLGKDGKPVQTAMPPGFEISNKPIEIDTGTEKILLDPQTRQPIARVPKDISGTASLEAQGKAQGVAQAALPAARQIADQVTTQIKELKADPYLPKMLGPVASRLPNVTPDAARVQARLDQLQGGAFMQARELLKGAGQVTDYEGRKAEEAFARLSTAQNEKDFKTALDDFNNAVSAGLKKIEAQAAASPRLPGAPAAQTPASSGPSNIPVGATVRQNGRNYQKQPNGSFVEVP